jgi:hypothetical protein
MAGPVGAGEVVRRRAIVVAATPHSLDLRCTEARCRGCVGCGGRCSLFASPDADVLTIRHEAGGLVPGAAVDVIMAAQGLRHAASRAYGIAMLAVLAGAGIGHLVGGWVDAPNGGALAGLLAGTFLAGRFTKRLAATPPLHVRPCLETDLESEPELELETKELPR